MFVLLVVKNLLKRRLKEQQLTKEITNRCVSSQAIRKKRTTKFICGSNGCLRKRCEQRPSFLLFRADVSENISGGRWLMVAWLPDAVPEMERLRRWTFWKHRCFHKEIWLWQDTKMVWGGTELFYIFESLYKKSCWMENIYSRVTRVSFCVDPIQFSIFSAILTTFWPNLPDMCAAAIWWRTWRRSPSFWRSCCAARSSSSPGLRPRRCFGPAKRQPPWGLGPNLRRNKNGKKKGPGLFDLKMPKLYSVYILKTGQITIF